MLYTSLDLRRLREAVAAQQRATPARSDGWGDIIPSVTEGLSRRRRKQRNTARWAGRRSAGDGVEAPDGLDVGDGGPWRSGTEMAMAFLVDLLYVTPVRSTEARASWRAAGFRDIVIRRAQRRLGIKPYQVGFHGGWLWALPNDDIVPGDHIGSTARQSP